MYVVNSDLVVKSSQFDFVQAALSGGALLLKSVSGRIENSSFFSSSAHSGGAIAAVNIYDLYPIVNCQFQSNMAALVGGAVSTIFSSIYLTNGEFIENQASSG